MKAFLAKVKQMYMTALVVFGLGLAAGQASAYASILTDCKVLGMFRFGFTPVGCQVGEKTR